MSNHFRVHELLNAEELERLEAFAREPGRTIDEVHEWLLAAGYTLARSSAGRWLRTFLMEDRFRAANESARALMETAKGQSTVAISDAATLKLSQMLFEQMLRMQSDEEVSTKDLWGLSMAVKNVVQGKRHIEKLRGEVAAALDEAQEAARRGGSAEAVVGKVREILGIK